MLDKDIRHTLVAHLLRGDSSAAVHHELPLSRGRGRADCAFVNGAIYGFEIKSDRDSLARLSQQIPHYERVCEYCSVVIAKKHLKRIMNSVPKKWGIVLAENMADGEVRLRNIRRPARNPNTDKQALVRLLWKEEAISALRNHGIACRRETVARELWAMLERLPKKVILNEVRLALKAREGR